MIKTFSAYHHEADSTDNAMPLNKAFQSAVVVLYFSLELANVNHSLQEAANKIKLNLDRSLLCALENKMQVLRFIRCKLHNVMDGIASYLVITFIHVQGIIKNIIKPLESDAIFQSLTFCFVLVMR